MSNSPYTDTSLHCPSQAQWLRYRRGQSSPHETRAIEEHFTDCALCSEAINTIMSTEADALEAQWATLKNPSQGINAQTTPPAETKKSTPIVQFLSPWLVAAVITGIVVGAYFIYQQSNQTSPRPLAQNTPTDKQTPAPPEAIIATNAEKTSNEPTVPSNKNTEPASPAATVKAIKPLPRLTDQSNTVPAKEETYALTENVRAAQADEAVSFQQTDATRTMETNTVAAAPAIAASAKETMVAKAYKKEKSRRSSEEKDAQPIAEASIPSGSELYLNGQYAEAIPRLLTEVNKQSPYQMEAIFLADAYIKTGKKQAAQTLLQKVVNEKGPLAKKAQQMLDLIQ